MLCLFGEDASYLLKVTVVLPVSSVVKMLLGRVLNSLRKEFHRCNIGNRMASPQKCLQVGSNSARTDTPPAVPVRVKLPRTPSPELCFVESFLFLSSTSLFLLLVHNRNYDHSARLVAATLLLYNACAEKLRDSPKSTAEPFPWRTSCLYSGGGIRSVRPCFPLPLKVSEGVCIFIYHQRLSSCAIAEN